MFARSLQHRFAPFAVACLAIAIFSFMDMVMKGLSIAIGAYNAMLWRTIAGVLITCPLFLLTGGRMPGRQALWLHLWRSLTAAISILLFFWGLVYTPLAQGIALSFIAPLIALGLASVFLKERIGRSAVGGALIAFAGMLVVLAGRARQDSGPHALEGAVAILAAALFYAVNLVLARRQSQAAGPMEVTFFFNLVALALYGMGAPWFAAIPDMAHAPLIIAAACSSSLSILLLAWAYARAQAQHLVSVEYTAFIWASLFGWLAFREPVLLSTLAGALLIVAGCLWAARGNRKPDKVPMTGPEAAG
ncbi:MAG: DMT family transporter [Sphingobium sp.]|nr:DMT family transporter [Sphingobium sp.]